MKELFTGIPCAHCGRPSRNVKMASTNEKLFCEESACQKAWEKNEQREIRKGGQKEILTFRKLKA